MKMSNIRPHFQMNIRPHEKTVVFLWWIYSMAMATFDDQRIVGYALEQKITSFYHDKKTIDCDMFMGLIH